MRSIARGALVIAMLVGVVWCGQGVGLIRGAFMTGRVEGSVIGARLAAAAALTLWWISRPRSSA